MNVKQIKFRTDDGIPPFLGIEDTCQVTGLSQYYLRNGCRSGEIPCVKSGRVYMINLPALLQKLNVVSTGSEASDLV